MYLQICTYPLRDLCLALTTPHLLYLLFLSLLRALFVLAPSCHRATPEPRTNNQVDVEQRTFFSFSFSLSSSIFACPSLISYLRFCPYMYVNHYGGCVCYIYAVRRICITILFHSWHTWIGYPFSFLVLR